MIVGNGRPSLYVAYGPDSGAQQSAPSRKPSASSQVDAWIVKYPAACIVAAVTLGMTLGWLIKRR
jgi:hypothetical protein